MIKLQTVVNITDNSGGQRAQCIKILGGSWKKTGNVGDIIVVSITKTKKQENLQNKKPVNEHEVHYGLVVRTKKGYKRQNGQHITFGENAIILLKQTAKGYQLMGTRIFGPIPLELRYQEGLTKNIKLLSLSHAIV